MKYIIHRLSPDLVLITWVGLPQTGTRVELAFLAELKQLLDQADQPFYLISDLRQGRIVDVGLLKQLADLTQHKNWAGSSAFANNPISAIFVDTFTKFAHFDKGHREIWDTPEEALAYLESLKPGITANIDWNEVIKSIL